MKKEKQELAMIFKFLVVNGLATVLNFILYYFFIELIGIYYIFANIFSYLIAVVLSYYFNSKIVFKVKKSFKSLVKFVVMKLYMGILGTIIMYLLVEFCHLGIYLGNIVTTIICVIFSYILSKLIFKTKEQN